MTDRGDNTAAESVEQASGGGAGRDDRAAARPERKSAILSALGAAFRYTAPPAVAALVAIILAERVEFPAVAVGGAAALGAALAALLKDRSARVHAETAGAAYTKKIGYEIVEYLPLSLFVLDQRGRVVFANAAALSAFGAGVVGRHFQLVIRAPALADIVEKALSAEVDVSEGTDFSALEWETSFKLHGGRERHMTAILRSVPPAVETPWGGEAGLEAGERRAKALLLLQDVTQARRAEQLHRDFIANASHELKTPLASITGFVETLLGPARDDPPAQKRFLGIIAEQAQRMTHLVQDLLSLNRIELNEHVPPRAAVDLAPIIEAAVKSSAPNTTDRRTPSAQICLFDVPEDRPEDLLVVRGDERELSLLFVNLIGNALKYGAEERPPRVFVAGVDEADGRVGVTVEDFGPGIPKDDIPRLCERFYRVAEGVVGSKSGTGLGLAIVKHVVSRHRGELVIESELDKGSRFTVWLPLAARHRSL